MCAKQAKRVLVKKTATGKFSFLLDYMDRDEVSRCLMGYLEHESVQLLTTRIDRDFTRHLLYYVANDLFLRHSGKFNSPHKYERFILTRAEVVCFLAIMDECISIELRQIRSTLHQLLS